MAATATDNSTVRSAGAESPPKPGQTLFTVNQMADVEPALTVGGIRADLFNRDTNGLSESGAVVRRGRRMLLDRVLYLSWLKRRGQRRPAKRSTR